MNTSLWIEKKYVNIISPQLPLFVNKTKSSYLVNFRCVFCNDSKSNKRKARGYIGEREGKLFYYCHNCGASMTFEYFLSTINPLLYKDYLKEKFLNERQQTETKEIVVLDNTEKYFLDDEKNTILSSCKKISQLEDEHLAKIYLTKRKIPKIYFTKFRYTSSFNKFVNSIIENKISEKAEDEPRIIIPFFDENGLCFGFQGRSLNKNSNLKYITIMLTNNKPKIFGLDTVDKTKKVYIFEGPLDSTFIENSVAVAGGDLNSLDGLFKEKVYVFDNEPRKPETKEKMQKIIEQNKNICIWPNFLKEKDVNDMILSGKKSLDISKIIDQNTVCGLNAKLKFIGWKK